jgi:hypothetical protein
MKEDEPESRTTATQVFEWLLLPGNDAIALPWLADDDELGDIWEWQLKLVLSKITLNPLCDTPKDNLVRLKLIEALVCKDTYTSKGLSAAIADSIQQTMASHLLIRMNIYSIIHTYFLDQSHEHTDQIEAVVGIIINIAKNGDHASVNGSADSITKDFVTRVLTIRLLKDRILENNFTKIIEAVGTGRILQAILKLGGEPQMEETNVIGLLENMISLKRTSKSALRHEDLVSVLG